MKNSKYIKSLIFMIISILLVNIFMTIFYYFNLINTNIMNYLKIITIIISSLIGGIYIGNKSNKNGWLEGIKIGLIAIIIFFIISFLAFDKGINIKSLIYYLIIITSTTTGSMIGINKKKRI